MSNIFITDIVGTGDFAVPATDAALATATTELDTLLQTVPDLRYVRALAWVETKDGASAPRTLNCLVERFEYDDGGTWEECPDASEVQTLTGDIETTLEADADITSIGGQQVHVYKKGEYYLWERDTSSGFLFTGVATDDVVVGGATPDGIWFQDGDLALGASAMSGTEKLRVVGFERLEGGLLMTEAAAVPLTPAAGEGTFWVQNAAPNIPKFTDDAGTDHTLAYASNLTSLFGIDQVIFVDKASGGSYTPDGTIQKPYNSVSSAVSAAVTAGASASNRFGIVIYPGIYEDTVNLSTQGIFLIGTSRENTIIQQSSGASTVYSSAAAFTGVANLTFRTTGTATGHVFYSTVSTTGFIDWLNCTFEVVSGALPVRFYRDMDLRAWNCDFIHDDDSQRVVDGGLSNAGFNGLLWNCRFEGQFYTTGTNGKWRFHDCYFTSSVSGVGTLDIQNPVIYAHDCYFENTGTGANDVAFYTRGGTAVFWGCTIRGGPNATYDTNSPNFFSNYVHGCRMRHGLHWGFRQSGVAELYAAGNDGDMDFYKSVGDAYNAADGGGDGHVIYMLGDDTGSTLTPGAVKTPMCIDGQGHTWTGGETISNGTTTLTVRNMYFTGAFRFLTQTWTLRLENVYVDGRIFWDTGYASTLNAHDCKFVGNSTYPVPLFMRWNAGTAGALYFDHCYVKGYTGNPAVDYQGVDYDSLYFSYSKVFHGDLGTNNPFANYDAGRKYYAHHCVFNQEPALADPNITNEIDSGQRYNTVDPDGDYYWLN
jgi:hypothetical protein